MILLRHTKLDKAKYLGHLDLLHNFQRIFARAEIPVEESRGFNPHPLFFFPQPLGLGIESECELVIVDTKFDENILQKLNAVSIPGVEFVACSDIEKDINLAANIVSSVYLIKMENINLLKNDIEKFLEQECIIISIKTKSGVKEKDVKEMILSYAFLNDGILFHLTCGNNNLRPDYLMNAIKEHLQKEFDYKVTLKNVNLKLNNRVISSDDLFC